jgi:hypothetical protein
MISGRAVRLPLLAALLLVGLTVAAAPTAVRADDRNDRDELASERRQLPPKVTLVDQEPWLHEGDPFRLTLRLDAAPADGSVVVQRLSSVSTREGLANAIEEPSSSVRHSTTFPVADLTPAADRSVEVVYATAEDPGLTKYGVYPVRVRLEDKAGETLADLVTFLVVLPAGEPQPLDVAVVMEVGATNGLQPDGTVQVDAEEQAAIRSRVDILEHSSLPITVAPRPETLDALADPANPDVEQGLQLVEDLARAIDTRRPLARPYVDLDLDALASANLLTQVPPETEAGAEVIRRRYHTNPVAGIWLANGTLGDAGVQAMQEVALAPHAIVPPAAIASVPGVDDDEPPTEPVALSSEGPLAFVADEDLSARLTGTEGELDAQRFLAELALIWMQDLDHERGVVVRLPETAALDVDTVDPALHAMATGQAVDVVSAGDLFARLTSEDRVPPVAELAPYDGRNSLTSLAEPLGRAQTQLPALASTLNDADLVKSLQRSLLVALGADTPADKRHAYVTRIDRVAAKLASEISAPADFQITLTARDGTIPLTLTNDSGQNVQVTIRLTSSQLTFPSGATLTNVVLEPGNTRIDLDVRTRTSGAFPLDIEVTSPDGGLTLDTTTFTIRSTAVSGAGIFLSVGAGLFLMLWWARHWRTTKRSQRLVAENGATPVARH